MIDPELTQKQLIFKQVKRGQGEFIRKKKHDNAFRMDYNGRSPTVLNAVRNWLVHASGLRVLTLEELQAISGFLESFIFLSGGSKFRHYQMMTDLIEPFQSEYNGLTVLLNLDKISVSRAISIIDSIPERAMDIIPSWSNPNISNSI